MKAITIALGAMLVAGQAMADGPRLPCEPGNKIMETLANNHDEFPTDLAITSKGLLLQVYRTEDGSTWTIVTTSPEGTSCIVAAGENWESMPVAAVGDPS